MSFWLNGEWRDDKDAIAIDDRGFLLGDAVFETMLVRRGRAAFFDAHLLRLRRGLQILEIPDRIPADIASVIAELAERNGIEQSDASLRLMVTRGSGARGLRRPDEPSPIVLMTISPALTATGRPRQLHVSRYRRAETSIAAKIKTPAYLDNILALQEARAAGADEAVMLNNAGRIACASAGNIFVQTRSGEIVTPALGEGALPGIVRGVLIAASIDAGAPIREGEIELDEILGAPMAVTNSLVGVVSAFLEAKPPPEMFNLLSAWYAEALEDDLRNEAGAT